MINEDRPGDEVLKDLEEWFIQETGMTIEEYNKSNNLDTED